jgi:hypothetical protein
MIQHRVHVIDPRGMAPRDWCDRMALELDAFGLIPIINHGMTWRDWALQVVQLQRISRMDPPNPDDFEDDGFEEWATYFIDAVFVPEGF